MHLTSRCLLSCCSHHLIDDVEQFLPLATLHPLQSRWNIVIVFDVVCLNLLAADLSQKVYELVVGCRRHQDHIGFRCNDGLHHFRTYRAKVAVVNQLVILIHHQERAAPKPVVHIHTELGECLHYLVHIPSADTDGFVPIHAFHTTIQTTKVVIPFLRLHDAHVGDDDAQPLVVLLCILNETRRAAVAAPTFVQDENLALFPCRKPSFVFRIRNNVF